MSCLLPWSLPPWQGMPPSCPPWPFVGSHTIHWRPFLLMPGHGHGVRTRGQPWPILARGVFYSRGGSGRAVFLAATASWFFLLGVGALVGLPRRLGRVRFPGNFPLYFFMGRAINRKNAIRQSQADNRPSYTCKSLLVGAFGRCCSCNGLGFLGQFRLKVIRQRLTVAAGRELTESDLARLCVLVTLHDLGKFAPAFQTRLLQMGQGLPVTSVNVV